MVGVTRFGRWGGPDGRGGSPAGVAAAAAAGLDDGGTGVYPVGLAAAAATIAAAAAAVVVVVGAIRLASGRVTSVPARRVGSSLPIDLPCCGKITPIPIVRRRLPPCPINPFLFVWLNNRVWLQLRVILMLKGLKGIGNRLRYWTRVNKSCSYFN